MIDYLNLSSAWLVNRLAYLSISPGRNVFKGETIQLAVLVNLPSQVHSANWQREITHDFHNCASLR